MFMIFTDGGSRGNPGPSAYAYIILDETNTIVSQESGYAGYASCNEAEYRALYEALQALTEIVCGEPKREQRVYHYTDSQLVVNQMSGTWAINSKSLYKHWQGCHELASRFAFTSAWLPRTTKHIAECDNECDRILDQLGYPGPEAHNNPLIFKSAETSETVALRTLAIQIQKDLWDLQARIDEIERR